MCVPELNRQYITSKKNSEYFNSDKIKKCLKIKQSEIFERLQF